MAQVNNHFFMEELSRIISSARTHRCIRTVLVTTRDREHAINLVKEVTSKGEVPLYHFTSASRRRYRSDRMVFETSGGGCHDPAELFRHASEVKGGGVIIFEDFLAHLQDKNGDRNARTQLNLMLSSETKVDGTVMVFIEPPESECHVPSILADQFRRIDVPMPRADELEAIAREEIAATGHANKRLIDVEVIKKWSQRLSLGLVGLTQSGARDALRDVLANEAADFSTAEKMLSQRKASQLSRELSMSLLESTNGQLPIGLDYLYDYIRINRHRIGTVRDDRAKAILLMGPPGTGKTMLARAIGQVLNLPVIEFRIAALMNSYLGETERRFEQAFAVLDAMAPSIVFIDEIEKAFAGQGGENDGGTMMRCTGRLLSWLSDSKAPNFIVATANNVRRMGEIGLTMTRRGRFDRVFFVDFPSKEARKMIFDSLLKPFMNNPMEIVERLAEMTTHFSGADIKSVVDDAVNRSLYLKETLDIKHLEYEIDRNRLRVEAIYDEFRDLRKNAKLIAEPAGPGGER